LDPGWVKIRIRDVTMKILKKFYVSESFSLKKLLEELVGELSIGVLTTDRSGAIKILMRYLILSPERVFPN